MTRSQRRVVALVVFVGVFIAACARSGDDTAVTTAAAATSAILSTSTTPADVTTPTTTSGSATTSGTATSEPATTESTTTVPAPRPGDFGDLTAVCGPGNDDPRPSSEQGVTDDRILVGTMADPGNEIVPGLNQEVFDAAEAFVAWCNEAGGIAGRQIELTLYDSALFDAAQRTIEACQSEFMLVGSGVALDDTAVEPRVSCGMPQIAAFTVSAAAGRAEGSIQALTNADYMSHFTGPYRVLAELDPDAVAHYGLLNIQLDAANAMGQRARAAAKDEGFTEVYYEEAPALVDNWRPFVENIKGAGVQVLTFTNTPENLSVLLRAMDDVGYFPKYLVVDGNYYNPKLLDEAGDTLDETTVLIEASIVPFELAGDDYPATRQFVDIVDRYTRRQAKSLGVNAFSAWLLWAVAATECAGLTRSCVMDVASAIKDWTGGGLHTPDRPASTAGPNSECFLVIQATPDGFVVSNEFTRPNDGIFNCDPANAVVLTGYQP